MLAKQNQPRNRVVRKTRSSSPVTLVPPTLKRSKPNARTLKDQIKEPKLPKRPLQSKPSRLTIPQTSNQRAISSEAYAHLMSGETSRETSKEVEVEGENRDNEIVDFAVELSYKIYINKSIKRRKDLSDTIRDALLDLFNLEEAICREVNLLYKTKHYSTLDIVQHTAFISVAGRKSIYKAHNLEDFGLQQSQVLEHMLNSTKEQYPLNKIIFTFEIKIMAPIPTKLSSKCKVETDKEESSLPLSSPLAIHERKKSSRTSVLQEQSKTWLDKILYVSEWKRQLTDRLTCRDKV
ncbi:MAG: hypothetical protein M1840_005034 [Geoglossum simile]|nr:MAG: hypothetical protein M1840_005034 [Geoglossum simile]